MPKAGFIVTRVSFLVLAASVLGAGMLAAPAAGQTCSGKCFAVAVSPPLSTGGQASFSFTITNEDSMQALGSVQITALAGFTITGASCPVPGCVTSITPSTKSTPGFARFLELGLQPGTTTSTPLTVDVTPSSGGAGTYQWGIAGKQSNDFSGSGNDFQLDPASTGLTGSISISQCTSMTSTCTASASSATTSGTFTTLVPEPGDSITVSAGAAAYTCAGVSPPFSDAFSFTASNAAGPVTIEGTVSQEIPKSFVESSGHTGTSGWQICYSALWPNFPTPPPPFTALPGTSGTFTVGNDTFETGLLPDCPNTNPQASAPCVQSRTKDNAGDVVVTYFAFTDRGDGTGKGAW